MYYIVSNMEDKILATCTRMTQSLIDGFAEEFGCEVYAIRGEHAGYVGEYDGDDEEDIEEDEDGEE